MLPESLEEMIRNKTFSRSIQGYHPKQVERFLQKMNAYYMDVYQKNQELNDKIAQYEKQDKYLRQALLRVEETTEEIKEKAWLEAERMKQQAITEAEKIRQEAIQDAERMKKQAVEEGEVFIRNVIHNRKLYEEQSKEWIGTLYRSVRSKINSLQEDLYVQMEHFNMNLEGILRSTDPLYQGHSVIKKVKTKAVEAALDSWKSKEEELLVGYMLEDDIRDCEGNLVFSKTSVVTPEMIEVLVEKELYGELLTVIGNEIYAYSK
jgi:DivIVA domain-containing protein